MRADSTVPVWGGRGWVGPSFCRPWQQLLRSGLGATVTSHPRDILKGASQQGDELWVGRCRGSASAVLIRPCQEDITFVKETLSECDNSRPVFQSPSGIWSSRQPFLQCCGIAPFPVSRRLVLEERCQMLSVGKRRLCVSRWRVSHSMWQTPRKLPRNRYPLRKFSRYLASTSLLRICPSVADGWVFYAKCFGCCWATQPKNVKGHPTLSPTFSHVVVTFWNSWFIRMSNDYWS